MLQLRYNCPSSQKVCIRMHTSRVPCHIYSSPSSHNCCMHPSPPCWARRNAGNAKALCHIRSSASNHNCYMHPCSLCLPRRTGETSRMWQEFCSALPYPCFHLVFDITGRHVGFVQTSNGATPHTIASNDPRDLAAVYRRSYLLVLCWH